MLPEQTLAGKDAPNAKSGRRPNDMKNGGAPNSRKETGQLAEEELAQQETDNDVECEL